MLSAKVVYNRSKRLRKDGTAKLHIRFTYLREVRYYDLKILLKPHEWNGSGIVLRNDAIDLSDEVDEVLARAKKMYRDSVRHNTLFTLDKLFDSFKFVPDMDFVGFVKATIDREQDLSESTIKKRNDFYNKLSSWKSSIPMGDVDYSMMVDFRDHLLSKESLRGGTLGNNYVASLFVLMRKFVRSARAEGLISEDPFFGFKIMKTAKIITVLSEDEIGVIEDFNPKGKYIRIKAYILFLLYTGIRIGDMAIIKETDFSDGMLRFLASKTRRSKGKFARIPLHLFDGKAYDIWKDWGPFKKVNNYEFNNGFRELLSQVGINKYMTAHDCRHTFKSIMLERGYPLHIIAEFMAHSSTHTTATYGSISDNAVKRRV